MIWTYLVFTDIVIFMHIDLRITEKLIEQSYAKYFFTHDNVMTAQILYDVSLILVVTIASLFLLPLSVLLMVQSKNFWAGMTTRNRQEAMKHNFNPAIVPISGREYAQ